ncbi:MAG: hypothetical protein K2Q06_15120, partial [Parvularculaceae bacterium]|nr:hypothetical protein [Parvularculaceae bacterium]
MRISFVGRIFPLDPTVAVEITYAAVASKGTPVMSGCGCAETTFGGVSLGYRRALVAVIAINATMFLIEITA